MKKQIIIFLLVFKCMFVSGQNLIKSTAPCNDALLQKTPGRWIKDKDNVDAPNLSKAQIQETLNRLDNIQQLVLKTYPTPTGVDAAWRRTVNDDVVSSHFKFSKTTDGGTPGSDVFRWKAHKNLTSCKRKMERLRIVLS